jgi:hypothetical protein
MAKVRDVHNRVLFEGTQEDCEGFVATHFPWNHVQPPGPIDNSESTPDVTIESDPVADAVVGDEE